MASPLADLDELVLKCRDQKSKNYIKEAVACYRAGAFRSAIILTWIAVSFDIVEKLKELTLAGDKEAEKQYAAFENARQRNDIAGSLKFEKEILAVCRDKLELISSIECIDLERLREDRNRCAHPSMISEGEVFTPSAELARMHIRSAIEHLLQYPPAQGKYALDSLVSLVDSDLFPRDVERAMIIFENTPLRHARKSLIKNFMVILLKRFLNVYIEEIYFVGQRILTALEAVRRIHELIFNETFEDKLSGLVRGLDIRSFTNIIVLNLHFTNCHDYFDADIKIKIESYIENIPSDNLITIEDALNLEWLKPFAMKRITKATRDEIRESCPFFERTPYYDRIIELYVSSYSEKIADNFSDVVMRFTSNYTSHQIKALINGFVSNSYISKSLSIAEIFRKLRENTNIKSNELEQWLSEAGVDANELMNRPGIIVVHSQRIHV